MKTSLLIILFVLGFASYPAFAREIPTQIRTMGDDLLISGTANDTGGNAVVILIKNQSGELILVSQVMPQNGVFSLEVKKQGPLWDNVKEFSVLASFPDEPTATLDTEEKSYREGTKSQNDASISVDFQALEASQSKCTVLGLSGNEACSLQSSLTLGITTAVIIGTVITISMFTVRKRK